jgi:hypothetical protein
VPGTDPAGGPAASPVRSAGIARPGPCGAAVCCPARDGGGSTRAGVLVSAVVELVVPVLVEAEAEVGVEVGVEVEVEAGARVPLSPGTGRGRGLG